jgi:hypothetical protein
MLPWAASVPLLKRVMPITNLTKLMAARRRKPGAGSPAYGEIARASWLASRLQIRRFPENCLERSLVTYRFLGLAGAEPRLILGVGKNAGEIIGHAWVTVDDRPVHESDAALARYQQLMEFDAGGAFLSRAK